MLSLRKAGLNRRSNYGVLSLRKARVNRRSNYGVLSLRKAGVIWKIWGVDNEGKKSIDKSIRTIIKLIEREGRWLLRISLRIKNSI